MNTSLYSSWHNVFEPPSHVYIYIQNSSLLPLFNSESPRGLLFPTTLEPILTFFPKVGLLGDQQLTIWVEIWIGISLAAIRFVLCVRVWSCDYVLFLDLCGAMIWRSCQWLESKKAFGSLRKWNVVIWAVTACLCKSSTFTVLVFRPHVFSPSGVSHVCVDVILLFAFYFCCPLYSAHIVDMQDQTIRDCMSACVCEIIS